MRNEKYDNLIIIIVITITLSLLLLQKFSLNHSFVVDGNTPFTVTPMSDLHGNSGKSEVTLIKDANKLVLHCEIIQSDYAWPYCEITVSFLQNIQGEDLSPIDLSSYSHAVVYADYINNEETSIRFQLRSFNNAYGSLDDPDSWKYNAIEYWPKNNSYPVTIPMNALQVSTWWLHERAIPIEYSPPELNQVTALEIATGNNIRPGHYQLSIERIEFTGKIFNDNQLYAIIIAMWLITALFGFILNIKRSKEKLHQAMKRTQELKKLNKLLNVESQKLKDRAERDPLTGALNRSGTESIFTEAIQVLSVIFIDVDHFKHINDHFGHAIGDNVLIELVNLISKNSRSTDFLARWGGEEFLLICPNTRLAEATALAEDLRLLIKEHLWPQHISLTSSFGVAQKTSQENISDFIERADKALYNAKAQGRNKVVTSSN